MTKLEAFILMLIIFFINNESSASLLIFGVKGRDLRIFENVKILKVPLKSK